MDGHESGFQRNEMDCVIQTEVGIITTSEARISFECHGSGSQVILFIHGGVGGIQTQVTGELHARQGRYGSAEAKTPMYASLLKAIKSESRTIVAYDRRGCGNSVCLNENIWYGINACISDAVAVLIHLDLFKEGFHVLGTSAGGPIAMQLAIAYPEAVKSVILLNTSANVISDIGNMKKFAEHVLPKIFKDALKEEQYFMRRKLAARIHQRMLLELESGEFVPEQEGLSYADVNELLNAILNSKEDLIFKAWKKTNRNTAIYCNDILHKAPNQIKAPVLIVHGDSDRIVPFAAGRELERKIPKAELFCIKGAGHGIASNQECQNLVDTWLVGAQSRHTSKL